MEMVQRLSPLSLSMCLCEPYPFQHAPCCLWCTTRQHPWTFLFLIFINDLPLSVATSQLLLFADDTKCVKRNNHCEDSYALQQDLHNLASWSEYWNLHFNESKCVLLRFSSSPVISSFAQTYFINNCSVALRESRKDLGIVMSHDLSWNKHYDYLLSKAYRTLGLLCRTFSNTMSIHAKKVLYISLVRSRLSYCSPIWRPRLLKDIKSIENVQRRATNYILQDYKSCYINKTSHATSNDAV